MRAKHIVVVFGYECHLVPELKGYLDKVVQFCNQHRPEVLIFCGGFTHRKTAPEVCEADLMDRYVLPRLIYTPHRVLETGSYTTLENAKNSAKLVRDQTLGDIKTHLTVFCEATRAAEVDMVIRHFFGRRANIETASWELMAPEKRIISMIWTWISLKFPRLASYHHNQRYNRSFHI